MQIPEQFLTNQAFQHDLIGFDDRLPDRAGTREAPVSIPKGAEVLPDGTVKLSFYAPKASEVTATNFKKSVSLTKDAQGLWTGELKYDEPGFKQLQFAADGNPVLNYMAPIGFGSSHPINYVEVPDTDCDFLLLKDVPHGSVTREFFRSKVTGQYESCLVYTPPCYHQSTRSYPVLYLQHGGGENENSWIFQGKTNFIMDNLLAEGKAEPCLIVMCCGMVQVPDENGVRHVDYDRFNEMLVDEVIPFIEGRYRVAGGKWNRAYAGLSMGSLECGQLILHNFDVFGAAGLFTGFLYPSKPVEDFDPAPFRDAERFNSAYRVFFRAMGDQETSIPLFAHERKLCQQYGIHTVEKIYPGEHEWRVWRNALHDFLQLIFK